MFKKTIITYYAVWYLAHKNSKHAKDFSHYWLHAILQVAESGFAILIVIDLLNYGLFGFDGLFGVRPIFNQFGFWLVFVFFPVALLYYLIFHQYKVDKHADKLPIQLQQIACSISSYCIANLCKRLRSFFRREDQGYFFFSNLIFSSSFFICFPGVKISLLLRTFFSETSSLV